MADAADAIWRNDRKAVRHALAANPLVLSLSLAEALLETVYARHSTSGKAI